MIGRMLSILVLGAMVLAAWGANGPLTCGAEDTRAEAEEAYKKAVEARTDRTPAEKLAITKAFLEKYPESSRTVRALSAAVYYQGEALGDMEGAIAYAEEIRSKISDPEIAKDLDKEMIVFYGDAEMTDKMLAVANRLTMAGDIGFPDQWNVIEAAIRVEDWKLARKYCRKAKRMATAEAFRADWPDYEFTDEEVDEYARNRVGMLLVKDGWARANLGEVDEALADFGEADDIVRRSYVGIPENDLNLYWGETLLEKGDYEAAIERLAPDALIMRNEDALAGLEKAYVGLHGSKDGYDDYAAKLHISSAKVIDDFELPDYDGRRRRLSDLRGDVTLVAFWFPT